MEKPLDLWLCFLQNVEKWDADAFLGSVDIPEFRWAVGVLKTLAQDHIRVKRRN